MSWRISILAPGACGAIRARSRSTSSGVSTPPEPATTRETGWFPRAVNSDNRFPEAWTGVTFWTFALPAVASAVFSPSRHSTPWVFEPPMSSPTTTPGCGGREDEVMAPAYGSEVSRVRVARETTARIALAAAMRAVNPPTDASSPHTPTAAPRPRTGTALPR